MFKGRILPLILAFLVITGLTHNVSAETFVYPEERSDEWASSCSSVLVSTPLCDEFLTQSCIKVHKEPETVQTQSSVIITSPKETAVQTTLEIQPETISEPPQAQAEPTPQELNLDSDKIFDLVNQYRASQGLVPFEREESVCQLAQVRSGELAGELLSGTIHAGLYNRSLPYWIWENAKVGSNEEEIVAWWLASPLHHQSIVGDYKYSCVKCQGINCTQLFTSFVAK